MPDYTSRMAQARSLRLVAFEEREEREARNRARLAAYAWLAREPQGQVILDDLALVLLKPCETPHDEGERRLVLKIFEAVTQATQRQESSDDPA